MYKAVAAVTTPRAHPVRDYYYYYYYYYYHVRYYFGKIIQNKIYKNQTQLQKAGLLHRI